MTKRLWVIYTCTCSPIFCVNSSSCHNMLILLSLSGVTTLSLLVSVCAACMRAYRCLQMKWWAAVTVVAIPSQKALLMCPYVSSGNFQCLHRVVLVPFCIIYSLHLIVVWFLQAIWLPEWSLQLPSFLVFYVSKGRAGRSNTSLRALCFHFAVPWTWHTHTINLPKLTLSPHDTTQPPPTQPHHTFSYPHPPLAPPTPPHYALRSHPHPPRARNFCSILFPTYSSHSFTDTREGDLCIRGSWGIFGDSSVCVALFY